MFATASVLFPALFGRPALLWICLCTPALASGIPNFLASVHTHDVIRLPTLAGLRDLLSAPSVIPFHMTPTKLVPSFTDRLCFGPNPAGVLEGKACFFFCLALSRGCSPALPYIRISSYSSACSYLFPFSLHLRSWSFRWRRSTVQRGYLISPVWSAGALLHFVFYRSDLIVCSCSSVTRDFKAAVLRLEVDLRSWTNTLDAFPIKRE